MQPWHPHQSFVFVTSQACFSVIFLLIFTHIADVSQHSFNPLVEPLGTTVSPDSLKAWLENLNQHAEHLAKEPSDDEDEEDDQQLQEEQEKSADEDESAVPNIPPSGKPAYTKKVTFKQPRNTPSPEATQPKKQRQ